MHALRQAAWLPPLLALAAGLLLDSCAQIPVIDEGALLKAAPGSDTIRVFGARGPLSHRESKAVLARVAAEAPSSGALERHLAIEQLASATPLYVGNRVRILRDGSEAFPTIFADIAAARREVLLEYYIFEDVSCNGETLSDLLVRKSAAGVAIRIIYDGVGSLSTPRAFFDKLRNAGVQLIEFNPPNPLHSHGHFAINARDHRKILVADGQLAILGGVNLSSTYESAPGAAASSAPPRAPQGANSEVWHDTDVEIAGPAAPALARLFRQHWREQTGVELDATALAAPNAQGPDIVHVIASSPARFASRYYVTVLSAIRNAESSIWMTAAYFVPTHQEREDLLRAARRGVDVRLLLPSHSDSGTALELQRAEYPELLRAGVKIYERQDGILHSKTMVIDGVWSIIGSSNFDHRSVLFNDEVDAVVLGVATAGQLSEYFQKDLAHANAIGPDSLPHRNWLQRLGVRFLALWKTLI